MSKMSLPNPPPYPSVYGSGVVQTTLGPLNISGSPHSGVWTQSAYPSSSFGSSGHAISGPPAHVLWSTFRFDAKEWTPGCVVRMFATGRGQLGQGHPSALTDADTNILTPGRLPIAVDIRSMAWNSSARP